MERACRQHCSAMLRSNSCDVSHGGYQYRGRDMLHNESIPLAPVSMTAARMYRITEYSVVQQSCIARKLSEHLTSLRKSSLARGLPMSRNCLAATNCTAFHLALNTCISRSAHKDFGGRAWHFKVSSSPTREHTPQLPMQCTQRPLHLLGFS